MADRPVLSDDGARIRDRIVAGTLELIDAEGSGSLTVRRMAASADRSSMCVYSVFGNRRTLLGDVWDACADDLAAATAADGPDGTAAADAYREWARSHPGRYAFLWDVDPASIELDGARRAALLDRLAPALGGVGGWAALHGEVVAARIGAEAASVD